MQRRQWFSCFNASFEMGSSALHYIFIRPSHTLPKCHVTKALKKACLCNSIASPVLHATGQGWLPQSQNLEGAWNCGFPRPSARACRQARTKLPPCFWRKCRLKSASAMTTLFPTWLWGKILTSGNLQMRSNEKDLNVFYQAMALLVAWIVCYWKVMLANLASPAALSLSMVCSKRGTRFSRGSCIGLGILYTF